MKKLLNMLARSRRRRGGRRVDDPTLLFTPRDWADLPPHHPLPDIHG